MACVLVECKALHSGKWKQQQHRTSLDQLRRQHKCTVMGKIYGHFYSHQFPLCWVLHSIRTQAMGETPPVSLLSWSRGGLVNDLDSLVFLLPLHFTTSNISKVAIWQSFDIHLFLPLRVLDGTLNTELSPSHWTKNCPRNTVPWTELWTPKVHSDILSPRHWRTMIHWNVVPTIFHNDHISQGLCKIFKIKFQCIVVLQSRGEGPENQY